jgi:hypothetical protein
LTKGFFADLIETRAYACADREKRRFRSFLLGTLKRFIADVRDRVWGLKRGGEMKGNLSYENLYRLQFRHGITHRSWLKRSRQSGRVLNVGGNKHSPRKLNRRRNQLVKGVSNFCESGPDNENQVCNRVSIRFTCVCIASVSGFTAAFSSQSRSAI